MRIFVDVSSFVACRFCWLADDELVEVVERTRFLLLLLLGFFISDALVVCTPAPRLLVVVGMTTRDDEDRTG